MTKFPQLLLFYLGILCLKGCTVGPDYARPPVEIPTAYKEGSSNIWKVATPQDIQKEDKWWLIFNDSILNDLEEQATQFNQNIVAAQAQYGAALAILQEAKGALFPTIQGTFGDTKTRPQISGSNSSGRIQNTASIGIQTSWEIDFWGKFRRAIEADKAAVQASAAQLAEACLSIQATLAQTYFQLRILDELQILLEKSVQTYEKLLSIYKNQYKAGTISSFIVSQAQSQLQTLKVAEIDNQVLRAQYEHAIAILINKPPAHFSLPQKSFSLTPPLVTMEIPSELLERRPDIAAAERLMAQANAQIGVAESAFFPAITLSGAQGYYEKSLSHLFSAPSVAWSLGGQLSQIIFDGGIRSAAVKAADETYKQTVANYRQTVLTAFQEVEDNLSTLRILKKEYDAQDRATQELQKQVNFIENQYKQGIVASTDVLTNLVNLYEIKETALSLRGRQITATVGLIKALGGGMKIK